jgi:ABC-2 type transport system permease protein
MRSLRLFTVGGVIAYRATFNWIRPSMYVPTMLGGPLFQIVFWVEVGRASGARSAEFFLVGNAVQVCAMAGIYGSVMTVGNERYYETLGPLLASPANRVALFLGRAVPQIASGLVVSAFGFAVGVLLLDFRPGTAAIAPLAAIVLVTTASCTAFGMLLGSVGLRARDIFFIANLVYFGMLLVCGVNVPLTALPAWLRTVAACLPLTHGIAAARLVSRGASLSSVSGLVGREALIGALYALAAVGLFRLLELESRRRGTVETM